MKAWTFAALGWGALISIAGRSEPAAAWLAIGAMAWAPLALAILASLAKPRRGAMRAAEAEALAWSQPAPPAPRPPAGRAIRTGFALPLAQPLSA